MISMFANSDLEYDTPVDLAVVRRAFLLPSIVENDERGMIFCNTMGLNERWVNVPKYGVCRSKSNGDVHRRSKWLRVKYDGVTETVPV